MGLVKRTIVLVVGPTVSLEELTSALLKRNVQLARVADQAEAVKMLERSGDTFGLVLTENEALKATEVEALRRFTSAPIVWGVASGGSDATVRTMPNVKVITRITPAAIAQINEMMVGQLFNLEMARAVRQCTVEAFSEGFATTTSVLQPFIAEVREPLHEVMAFIGFVGPTASGYLSVNTSGAYLEGVHKRMFKKEESSANLIRSMAAEMVNQVFGRFKAFLEMHSMTVNATFPIVLEGKQRNMNYRPGRVSLVHQFKAERSDLYVELCIDPVNPQLVKSNTVKAMRNSEIQFL